MHAYIKIHGFVSSLRSAHPLQLARSPAHLYTCLHAVLLLLLMPLIALPRSRLHPHSRLSSLKAEAEALERQHVELDAQIASASHAVHLATSGSGYM